MAGDNLPDMAFPHAVIGLRPLKPFGSNAGRLVNFYFFRTFQFQRHPSRIVTIMADFSKPQKVVIVGAGPVGSLAALYAAARGDDVEVYELRGGTSRITGFW